MTFLLNTPYKAKTVLTFKTGQELKEVLTYNDITLDKSESLKMNNYLNFENDLIQGSVRYTDGLIYFGFNDLKSKKKGSYDYIIRGVEHNQLKFDSYQIFLKDTLTFQNSIILAMG